MAYGTANVDTIQSSTAGTPPQFNDGNGTQVGTLCRAWVRFSGAGGASISASFNVSSVTYVGAGNYTVNFTNNFTDTNYSMVATAEPSSGTYYNIIGKASLGAFTRAVGSAQVCTAYVSTTGAVSTLYDSSYVNVSFFR